MQQSKPQNKLVSIVIPAYNSAKYISQMLDSLASQTYPYLEIIVAYDIKSTDNTHNILKNYRNIPSIIVDEAKDTSSGQARNRGAKLATGEYIIFLDADDKIIPTYIENLIEVFNQYPDLDVVCGNRISSTEDEVSEKYNIALNSKGVSEIYSHRTALKHILYRDTLAGEPWVWLVKRKYIIENNIFFPNYSHGDDTVWVFQLILNTSHIGRCSKIGYIFIQHPTSITNSISSPIEYWNKYSYYRKDIIELLTTEDPNIAVEFQNLEIRRLVRKLTCMTYKDFRKTLKSESIHTLYHNNDDKLLSRLSIITFNRFKYAYWRILRMKIFEKHI